MYGTEQVHDGGRICTAHTKIDNSYIKNCIVDSNSYGMYIANYCDLNVFYNNSIDGNANHGIYLGYRNTHNNFIDNAIHNNSNYGVFLNDENTYNIFEDNTIWNNVNDGIHLHYYSGYRDNNYNEILNNSICNNSGDGIEIAAYNYYNVVSGNILDDNDGLGIRVSQPENYINQNNTINDAAIYYYYDVHGTVENPIIIENLILNESSDISKISICKSSNITIRNCTLQNSIDNIVGIFRSLGTINSWPSNPCLNSSSFGSYLNE